MSALPEEKPNLVEVTFFPLDIDYKTLEDGSQQIRLFGTTQSGKKIVILDSTFHPYFYVGVKPNAKINRLTEKINALDILHNDKQLKVLGTQLVEKKFLDKLKKFIKVKVKHPSHISPIRKAIREFSGVDSEEEIDIKFIQRYLIDKEIVPCTLCKAVGQLVDEDFDADIILESKEIQPISSDLISPKILALDIETLCTGSLPNTQKDAIIMIAFFGSGSYQKVITWKKFKGAPENVVFVDGELELIEEFKNTIKQFKPDIIVGYGSDIFDFNFLKERAQRYNIVLNLGIDKSEIITGLRRRSSSVKIKGIPHLDVARFIRNILELETERYKLDLVARELVGKGKLFTPSYVRKISELWKIGLDEDLLNLVEYNLRDAQLAYELCLKILPTELQLIKLIGLPLFDVNRMTYGQLVERYIIKNAKRFNQIIPRIPNYRDIVERRKHTYTGGFVIEPKPGLYENICIFDFRSLYPTIIASHNVCVETINCACCQYKGGYKLENKDVWFCSKQKGFIPALTENLIERRRRIISILNNTDSSDGSYSELNARQYALKTVANSMYGYMGFPGSRWYSLECAQAVTSLGRKYIQMVIKEAEKFGLKVLYGDTDSLFLLLENKSPKEINRFLSIINSVLPKPMKLEYRDFYPAGIFLEKKGDVKGGAKKRYALLGRSGKIILKGVEAIRGDWSELSKNAQRRVLHLILKEKSVEKAAKYIQDLIKDVKERKLPLEDFIIDVRLIKDLKSYTTRSPHVAAAELAKEKGYDVRRGFVASYIVKKGDGKISERVILAEDAKLEDYDPNYYVDHQIIRAVYKIFEIFDYTEEKLKAGQTTLGTW